MTKNTSKKDTVKQMFDNIAPVYDFMNHFLSFGIDKLWRKKLRRLVAKQNPETIIDIATGTGDLAIELSKTNAKKITGIDISRKMLDIAEKKVLKRKLAKRISLRKEDGENISFSPESFDAASVAFGIRNFENIELGLNEVFRILKPGGMFYILEFGMPRNWFVRGVYKIYFVKLLPFIGKIFSKDKKAYSYLPKSVEKFIYGDEFVDILKNAGFENVRYRKLSMGITYLYHATKPTSSR
ncbi:MAG: bifunctional demethylmenaquinone methyltransferase/2-methoxy-6-polyprenyl-1,4-benzoquinol methylase UbiE [Bacteroidales bacterium]